MLIYNTVHITDYFQFIFSMLPPDFSNQPTNWLWVQIHKFQVQGLKNQIKSFCHFVWTWHLSFAQAKELTNIQRKEEKKNKQEKELSKKNTKEQQKRFPYKTTFLASSDDFLSIQINKSPEIIKVNPTCWFIDDYNWEELIEVLAK